MSVWPRSRVRPVLSSGVGITNGTGGSGDGRGDDGSLLRRRTGTGREENWDTRVEGRNGCGQRRKDRSRTSGGDPRPEGPEEVVEKRGWEGVGVVGNDLRK